MRIAFVYDRVNKFGGAERILSALHEMWPEAPLFTAVYNKDTASWANVFKIHPSFLQKIPFFRTRHELLPLLTPLAFESLHFDEFDVVLSITSADSKSIITKPHTLHVCYCLTPSRYLWNGYQEYYQEPGFGQLNSLIRFMFRVFAPNIRVTDYINSQRPDCYIAISNTVASRIRVYYKKDADVIYPPTDDTFFTLSSSEEKEDYYLIVSRLVPYKKVGYVIDAFNALGLHLKIVGTGIDEKRLKKSADKNIEFISHYLTDQELRWYYQKCKALIFPGDEDFGLTAVEAQLCGSPVIALKRGGLRESVISGVSGEFYESQNSHSLISALTMLEKNVYSRQTIRNHALHFSKQIFQRKMKERIMNIWKGWNTDI